MLSVAHREDKAAVIKEWYDGYLFGGSVVQTISDELTYDTFHASEDHLWSALLMTGDLTKADAKEDGETVSLRIPNREIATIYEDTVARLFLETLDHRAQKSMMENLWNGEEQAASKAISYKY